jgi:Tfp pilus assembly protein PilF
MLLFALSMSTGCSQLFPSIIKPTPIIHSQPTTSETRKATEASTSATPLSAKHELEIALTVARALEANGHSEAALAHYERARSLDPHTPGLAHRLAIHYDKSGDEKRARAEFEIALEKNPRDAELLCDFAYFHMRHGRDQQAEMMLRQVLAVDAGHPRAWNQLGVVLAKTGREDESLAAFQRVGTTAQAHYNLGVTWFKQGKTKDGAEHLRRARKLDLNPTEAEIADELLKVAADKSTSASDEGRAAQPTHLNKVP